jgi:nucleotidyltransferase/DNA polymerase involved in DNA repair
LAATYEAKAYGVWTATALREAKKLLAGTSAVFIETDMSYYERVSRKIFSLLAQSSITHEQYSIDEAFYEWTWLCTPEQAHAIAKDLQQQIFQATQMPISIWVWPTRIIAKIFASLRKPKGIVVWFNKDTISSYISHLPLIEIPFIWRKRAKQFPLWSTIGKFMQYPWEEIRKILWRDWLKLRLELHQYEAVRIERNWWPSSVWRAKSFHPHFINSFELLRERCIHNFEKVYVDLTKQSLLTRHITVSLKTKQFHKNSYSYRFPQHTIERATLLDAMKHCLRQCWKPWVLYRQTIIVCSDLCYQSSWQQSLFVLEEWSKDQQRLQRVMTSLNTKYWSRVVSTAKDHRSIVHWWSIDNNIHIL